MLTSMHLDNSLNKLFEQVSRNSLNNLTYVVKKNICKTHESKDMSKIQQMPQNSKNVPRQFRGATNLLHLPNAKNGWV